MATGKPCWSQQYQEVAALFHIGTTKSHPSIPEHLSLELKDFIPKCLQKEPHLRSGASELLQHPFVTGKYQETHPACRTLAMIGKPGVYSMPKPMQQNLHSVNIFADLSISQYLTTDHHPCSQQTLPLENYANMVGYPFLSEIYTYMPSTFKQAYACSSSAYNQSPTALRDCPGISYTLPQCKYVGSGSSLSQSAVVASGYGGGFGCMSGSFLLNRLASCEIETITGGDDLLRSQHKDANDFAMPIQKESCAMWVHGGPGASRETGSVLLASAYYNFLGKNQTASGGWLTPVFATS